MEQFIVTREAMRPASPEERCFYCHQPIGGVHGPECVLVQRKCRVRVEFEYDIEVPAFWDPMSVEFSRNESSRCATNIIGELEELQQQLGNECLCGFLTTTYLRTVEGPHLKES